MRVLALALLPLLLVASCTNSPKHPLVAVATPPVSASPQPLPSSPPVLTVASPTPSASTAPPARRCHTSDLTIALSSSTGAAGNEGSVLILRNRSATDCEVFGYIGLKRLDQHRRAILTHLTRGSGMLFKDPGPHRVVLAHGQAASAGVGWIGNPGPSDPPNGCPESTFALITPPDETTAKIVSAPIAACDGGNMYVTALVAGSTGPPF